MKIVLWLSHTLFICCFYLQASEMLEILTEYLRSTYTYCVWCGTSYNGKILLKSNCN